MKCVGETMKAIFDSLQNRARHGERGQVLVLFIFISVVVFGAAVIAIDLGTYVWERQQLEIAVDAAALAGGQELPESGSLARAKALEYVALNDPDVDPANVNTSFRCLVGDRDDNGVYDPSDVPAVCNPGAGAAWACADKLCVALCNPFAGSNRCNVLDVQASKEVSLNFTRVLGLPPLLLTASANGACKGFCGTAPTAPLDVVIVIDRSVSMSSSSLADAKSGARAVLEYFDPEFQHVALAVLGAGNPSNICQDLAPTSGGDWLLVPLSSDYKNPDGTLNSSSTLVATIGCITTDSAQNTNLGSPLSDSYYSRPDALQELLNSGQPNSTKGIILLTDGEARAPGSNPCQYANERATFVKDEDIEIYTIGYGVQGLTCQFDSGAYRTVLVTSLLAGMATDSSDDKGHCANSSAREAENNDGDHFLCQAEGDDLEAVFVTAASALAPGVRLIGAP